MSAADREYWNRRWAEVGPAPPLNPVPDPPAFADLVHLFPKSGLAIDVACGRGRSSVWLARLGLEVVGLDVAPVAIDLARQYAHEMGVTDICQFEVADLDDGLPDGPPANLVFSHLFWALHLTRPLVDRSPLAGYWPCATSARPMSGRVNGASHSESCIESSPQQMIACDIAESSVEGKSGAHPPPAAHLDLCQPERGYIRSEAEPAVGVAG